MANNNLLDEEEKTELNGTANETLDTARNTANKAVEDATDTSANDGINQYPSEPTFSRDEMFEHLRNGTDYTMDEINSMSDAQYEQYSNIAKHGKNADAGDVQRKDLSDRLALSDDLEKKANFVVEHTKDDADFTADHDDMAYSADWLKNHKTTFAKMSDDDVAKVSADIEQKYQAATKRMGHLEHAWNQLAKGYMSIGNMVYQGMKMTAPGSLDEEDRDLIKGTMQTEKDLEIENPQKIGGFENINSAGDFVDYLSDTVLANIPRAGVSMGLATAGATVMPYNPIIGSMLFGSLGTMWMNTGEAVQDIMNEDRGGDDGDIRNSRVYALLQGAGYSVLDGAFGVSVFGAKLWSKMLQKAGMETLKDAAKGAGVEFAKDTMKKSSVKELGKDLVIHGGFLEGLQETTQSGVVGRGVRALQTGTLFKRKEDGTYETPKEAWWEAANEFVGGAVTGLALGSAASVGAHIDAKKSLDGHVNNVMSVVKEDPKFQQMDDYTKLLVSKKMENEAYLATTHYLDPKYLKALEKCNKDIDDEIDRLSNLQGEKNAAARISGQSAKLYLDIFNSQYALQDVGQVIQNRNRETGKWLCNDGVEYTPRIDVDGMKGNYDEFYNKAKGVRLRIFTNPVKGSEVSIGQILDDKGDPTGKYIFNNDHNYKIPVFGKNELICDNIGAAIEKACDLDVFNQWRANKMKAKTDLANQVFNHLFGQRGFKLNLVDRPTAGQGNNATTTAGVNAETRTVTLDLSKINNLGKLYTTLMHERAHSDIVDFLLKSGKWSKKVGQMNSFDWAEFNQDREALFAKVEDEFGISAEQMSASQRTSKSKLGKDGHYSNTKTEWGKSAGIAGEEMVVERSSVRELTTGIRKANRGIAGQMADGVNGLALKLLNKVPATPGSTLDRVRQTIAQKMALDMGVNPMAIMNDLDANVAEEMKKIFEVGYLGKPAESFVRENAEVPKTEGRVWSEEEVAAYLGDTITTVRPDRDEITIGTMNTKETEEKPKSSGPKNPKNLKPALKNGEGSVYADGSVIRRADGTAFIKNGKAWNNVDTNENVDDATATQGGYTDFKKVTDAKSIEKSETKADDLNSAALTETVKPEKTEEAATVKPKIAENAPKTASEAPVKAEKENGNTETAKSAEAVSATSAKVGEKEEQSASTSEPVRANPDGTIVVEQNKTPTVVADEKNDTITVPTVEATPSKSKSNAKQKAESKATPKAVAETKADAESKGTSGMKKMTAKVMKRVLEYNGKDPKKRMTEEEAANWLKLNELPVGHVVTVGGEEYTRVSRGENDSKDHSWENKNGVSMTQYSLASKAANENKKINTELLDPSKMTDEQIAATIKKEFPNISDADLQNYVDLIKAKVAKAKPNTNKAEVGSVKAVENVGGGQPINAANDTIGLNKIDAEIDDAINNELTWVGDKQRAAIKNLAHQHGEVNDITQIKGFDGYAIVEFDGYDAYLDPNGKELSGDEVDALIAKRDAPSNGEAASTYAKSVLELPQLSQGRMNFDAIMSKNLEGKIANYTGLSGDALLALATQKRDYLAFQALMNRWSDGERGLIVKWLESKKIEKNEDSVNAIRKVWDVWSRKNKGMVVSGKKDVRVVDMFIDMATKQLSDYIQEASSIEDSKRNYEAALARLSEEEKKALQLESIQSFGAPIENPIGRTVSEDILLADIMNGLMSGIMGAVEAKTDAKKMMKLSEKTESFRAAKAGEKLRAERKEALKSGKTIEQVAMESTVPDWYRKEIANHDEKWLCHQCVPHDGKIANPYARNEVYIRIMNILNKKHIGYAIASEGFGNSGENDVFDGVFETIEKEWKDGAKFWTGEWANSEGHIQRLSTHVLSIANKKIQEKMAALKNSPESFSLDKLTEEAGSAAESYAALHSGEDEANMGNSVDSDVSIWGAVGFVNYDEVSDEEMRRENDFFENVKQAVDYLLESNALSPYHKSLLQELMAQWQNKVNDAVIALETAKSVDSNGNTINKYKNLLSKAYGLKFDDNSVDYYAATALGMKKEVYRGELTMLLKEIEKAIAGERVTGKDIKGELTKRDRAYLDRLARGLFGKDDVIEGFERNPVTEFSDNEFGYNRAELFSAMRQNGQELMAWCCRLAEDGMSNESIEKEMEKGNAKGLINFQGSKNVETLLDHAYTDYGWINKRVTKSNILPMVKKVMDLNHGEKMYEDQVDFVSRWMSANNVSVPINDLRKTILDVIFKSLSGIVPLSKKEIRAEYAKKRKIEVENDHNEVAKIIGDNGMNENDAAEVLKKRGLSDKRIKQMIDRYVSVELAQQKSKQLEAKRAKKEAEKNGKVKESKAEPKPDLPPTEQIKQLPYEGKKEFLKMLLSLSGKDYMSDDKIIEMAVTELGMSKLSAKIIVKNERPQAMEMSTEEMQERKDNLPNAGLMSQKEFDSIKKRVEKADAKAAEKPSRSPKGVFTQKEQEDADIIQDLINRVGQGNVKKELRGTIKDESLKKNIVEKMVALGMDRDTAEKSAEEQLRSGRSESRINEMIGNWIKVYGNKAKSEDSVRNKNEEEIDDQQGKASLDQTKTKKYIVGVTRGPFGDYDVKDVIVMATSKIEAENIVRNRFTKDPRYRRSYPDARDYEYIAYELPSENDILSPNGQKGDKKGIAGGGDAANNSGLGVRGNTATAGRANGTAATNAGVERKGTPTGLRGVNRNSQGNIGIEPYEEGHPEITAQFRDGVPESEWIYSKTDVDTDQQQGRLAIGLDRAADGMYSKLEQVVKESKQDKFGASSLIPFLKGRGVKDEEIKVTGLEAFLDGKKSVTKDEVTDWVRTQAYVLKRNESGTNPKYASLSAPGGKNYREVLFEDPNISWENPHWDSRSVVAHTRIQDFGLANNNTTNVPSVKDYEDANRLSFNRANVLFVEEVQSDLHQAGREGGYRDDNVITVSEARKNADDFLDSIYDKYNEPKHGKYNEPGKDIYAFASENEIKEFDRLCKELRIAENNARKIPSVPYKTTWHEYVMKQNIMEACRNGYDFVAWTTGKMQADRYDLTSVIDGVVWNRVNDIVEINLIPGGEMGYARGYEPLTLSVNRNNGIVERSYGVPNAEGRMLVNIVGKDLSRRIISEDNGDISTNGLYVGGEGMRNFYDVGGKSEQNIPKFVAKYIKPWGGKLEEITLSNGEKVIGFRIPDKMREDINNSGVARFHTEVATEDQMGRMSLDDTGAFFGAKKNIKAHGRWNDDAMGHTRKKDVITTQDAELLLANKDVFAKVVAKANNFESITDVEARALTIAAGRRIADGIDNHLTADENEINETAIDEIVRGLVRGLSKAGSTLRMAKVGFNLRTRDSIVYITEQVRAQLEKEDEKKYGSQAKFPEMIKALFAKIKELKSRIEDQVKEMAKQHDIIEKQQQIINDKNRAADEKAIEKSFEEGRRIGREEGRKEESEAEKTRRMNALNIAVKEYGADADAFAQGADLIASLGDLYGESARFAGNPESTLDNKKRIAFAATLSAFGGDVEKAKKYLTDKYDNFASKMEKDFDQFVAEQDKANKSIGLTEGAKKRKRKESTDKIVKENAPKSKRKNIESKIIDKLTDAMYMARNAADEETSLQYVGESARLYAKLYLIKNPEAPKNEVFDALLKQMNGLLGGNRFDLDDVRDAILGIGDFKLLNKSKIQISLDNLLKAKKIVEEAKGDRSKIEKAIPLLNFKYESDADILQELDHRIGLILNRKLDVLESRMNEDEESNKELRGQIRELIDALHDIRSGTQTLPSLLDKYIHLAEGMNDYRRQKGLLERINSRIAMYQRKIDNNDFEPAPKRENPNTEKEITAIQDALRTLERMREKFKNERKAWKMRKEPIVNRTFSSLLEILGEVKALAGSMDFSSVLRQGGQMTWAHPIIAAKNIKRTFDIFRSEEKCNDAFSSIWHRPNAKYYLKAGIDFTDWGSNAANSEDLFLLNQYRKFTKIKLIKMGIESSERAFSMFLNLMRADAFDAMIANSPARVASAFTDAELKTIGNYINIASQRGVIDRSGALGKALPFLNGVLWSPRNMVSRMQFIANTATLLLPGAKTYGTTDWKMRKMLAKETARYFTGVSVAIAFTKMMADLLRGDDEPPEDIELDPRSSGFLEVKIGNTHLDFLSGLKQFIVFSSRFVSGNSKTARGQIKNLNRAESVGKFLRSKFSPASSIIYDMVSRENYDKQDIVYGNPFIKGKDEIGVARYVFGQMMPLTIGDVKEQLEENGIGKTAITWLYAMLGAGANTYDPYTYKQLKGDYQYFRRLLRDANTEEERKSLYIKYPMLRNSGPIEAQIKWINSIQRDIKALEKAGGNTDNLNDLLERARKQAINLMTGVRNPMDVQ